MKTSHVVLASLSVLGAAGIGYAVYFDYRRQTDPAFRKSLKKDNKRTSKANKKEAARRAKEEDRIIETLLAEIREPGAFPSGVQEREQYFLKYVSLGEQLFAMGPEQYLEAAIAFVKAMKVYPQPVELIMIYQKTLPKEVFDTIMRIVSKDIASGGSVEGAGDLDDVDEAGPSASVAEIHDDESKNKEADQEISPSTSAATSTSQSAIGQDKGAQLHGTDSGTTSSQEWDTLSATSLNDTGVIVTPNSAPSTSGDSGAQSVESSTTPSASVATGAASTPELNNLDTSAESAQAHNEAESTPSNVDVTSSWNPAPVFPSAEKEAAVPADKAGETDAKIAEEKSA